MQSQLPISEVVAVSVTLTPAGAQAQSLSNLLVLGTSTEIDTTERYRVYSTLAGVALDFGTTAQEYLAAQRWFGQSPQPTSLIIGRWVNAPAQGGLRGGVLSAAQQSMAVWNAIVSGGFKYVKDGAAAVNVSGLNFGAAANLNAVAGIIQGGMTGVTCVWNATLSRFEFKSATTGAGSSIGFMQSPTAGTDISATMGGTEATGAYTFVGQAAETALAAVTLMDNSLGQQWYGVVIPSADNAAHQAVAGYIEGTNTKHIYGITTQDAGTLVASNTTNIGYLLKQLGYRRTMVQYSSSDANAIVSAMGRILTTDFNGNSTVITLKFKQEPGIAAETLNTNQVAALRGFNVNVFVLYNNATAIIQEGVMVDGTFVDIVTGTDWLAIAVQQSVYNLLYTSPTKIPQTNRGMQILTTACEDVCSQAVRNGLLAPGVWNSNGFGQLQLGDYMAKGFYVFAEDVGLQNTADRAARLATPIQIAAKLAGAIHHANIAITVNQ